VPSAFSKQEIYLPPQGAQATPADWAALVANMDNAFGWFAALLGINNGLPANGAVTVVPLGAMVLQIGGTAQLMIAQGRRLDTCPVVTLAPTTGDAAQPRIDLIAVRATRVQGSTSIARTVRADSATPGRLTLTGTLVAGGATV
jgi:hypothetical protein